MQITIDTNNLSELDINMLAFLADQGEEVEETLPEPPEAKQAAPKKAVKPAVVEQEVGTITTVVEEEVVVEEEELIESEGPTMAEAVAAATKLVSEGEAAKVKAALADVGAKRVSEMEVGDIPAFLAALEA